MSNRRFAVCATSVFAVILFAALPASAAGFALFIHGAKATGMGDGAVVAQADDGSATFFNAAGLAFQRERAIQFGGTFIKPVAVDFSGEAPFPGPDQFGEGEEGVTFPFHLYYVQPIRERWTFGLGVYSPFGLRTEWKDRDSFSGRFLSYYADITVYDVNPNLAWQANDKLAFGAGLIARASSWKQRRRIARVNPFTGFAVDVADVNLGTETGTGFGWNAGMLHRPYDWFSWGLSYRSQIDVDYDGKARLLQLTSGDFIFDQLVASVIPFDTRPQFDNELAFPDLAAVGFAFRLKEGMLLETDVNWMGWDSFESLDLSFPGNPSFDEVNPQNFEDTLIYRAGLEVVCQRTGTWRFGLAYDETPQPDAAVSPLLSDNDRRLYSIGWGREGRDVALDLAILWVDLGTRSTSTSDDNFNGTYESDAFLLAFTVGF